MKPTSTTKAGSTPNFPFPKFAGIVRDPESGRLCALPGDIAKGLNLHRQKVKRAIGRVYGGRHADLGDVIANRAATRGKGRPPGSRNRPKGMVLGVTLGMLAAITIGVMLAAGAVTLAAKSTVPTMRASVACQEARTLADIAGLKNLTEKDPKS